MFNRRVSLAMTLLAALGFGKLPAMSGNESKSSGLGGYRSKASGSMKTVKADQRAAAKRRNVIRNRNAHKRASCK